MHPVCSINNDQAGRKCLEDIQKMFHGKEIKDMSSLYGQHEDLNEMLHGRQRSKHRKHP